VLFHVLRLACPTGLRVVPEPAIQLSGDTEFVPDPASPELIAFELRDGCYAEAGLPAA
jgi:hypothetical protein